MYRQFSIIPDATRFEESELLRKKWKLNYEWNDYYAPVLLDNQRALEKSVRFWKKKMEPFPELCANSTIHGAFLDICLHSQDKQIAAVSRRRIEQAMEIAQTLSIKGVVIHSGLLRDFEDSGYIQNWLKQNESVLRQLLEDYPRVSIYMENMFERHPMHLQQLARNMTDCHRFGICLDYSHAELFGGDAERWMEVLAPYMKHMHINDHDGIGDRHMPIGEGIVDWIRWSRLLDKYAYEGSILIEMTDLEQQEASLFALHNMGILSPRDA